MGFSSGQKQLVRRFAVGICLGLFLPLLVGGSLWCMHLHNQGMEDLHRRHERVLNSLATNMLDPLRYYSPETASTVLKLLLQDNSVQGVRVYSGVFDMDLASFTRASQQDVAVISSRKHVLFGGEVLGFVELSLNTLELEKVERHQWFEVSVLTLYVCTVSSVVLFGMFWIAVLRPFGRLEEEALRVAEGGYAGATPSTVSSSFDLLSRSIETLRIMNAQAEERIAQLQTRDPETNVFNREYFLEVAMREIELARRFGLPLSMVLFAVDIPNSPCVDDVYDDGNMQCLPVVELVRARMRPHDILGRWSERVFVLLMPEQALVDGTGFAENVCTVVGEFCAVRKLTCSFGVSAFWSSDTVYTLYERADSALYRAMESGGNRVESV